jgi:hypothetical protein
VNLKAANRLIQTGSPPFFLQHGAAGTCRPYIRRNGRQTACRRTLPRPLDVILSEAKNLLFQISFGTTRPTRGELRMTGVTRTLTSRDTLRNGQLFPAARVVIPPQAAIREFLANALPDYMPLVIIGSPPSVVIASPPRRTAISICTACPKTRLSRRYGLFRRSSLRLGRPGSSQ